jgi:hypothetical protein
MGEIARIEDANWKNEHEKMRRVGPQGIAFSGIIAFALAWGLVVRLRMDPVGFLVAFVTLVGRSAAGDCWVLRARRRTKFF